MEDSQSAIRTHPHPHPHPNPIGAWSQVYGTGIRVHAKQLDIVESNQVLCLHDSTTAKSYLRCRGFVVVALVSSICTECDTSQSDLALSHFIEPWAQTSLDMRCLSPVQHLPLFLPLLPVSEEHQKLRNSPTWHLTLRTYIQHAHEHQQAHAVRSTADLT